LTSLHYLGFNLLLALVGLHLAAILFYRFKRRVDLVRPMLTGWKETDASTGEKSDGRRASLPALALASGIAAAAVAGILALEPPPPPPPPAVTTPEW
jgi:hypothetical protein